MGNTPVIPGAQFMATPLQRPSELIAGIVDQASKLAIGGGSKAHKSWIFTDLALSIATGTDWLGFKTGTAPQRVLYLNFEIPAYHFQRRLGAVAAAKGIAVPDTLGVWNLRGCGVGVDKMSLSLVKAAKDFQAAMFITDPLYKLLGDTDENSASEMAKLFNALEAAAVEANATAAYAGHFSKGNQAQKEAIDRISGSGVHGRDPDAIINFTPHKEPNAYTVDVILRYNPPVEPFVVRWEFPLMKLATDLDPKTLRAGGSRKKYSAKELINIVKLRGKIESRKEFWVLAHDRLNMCESTFKKLLKLVDESPDVRHEKPEVWEYVPSN
jgi:AAA domain-containing protein